MFLRIYMKIRAVGPVADECWIAMKRARDWFHALLPNRWCQTTSTCSMAGTILLALGRIPTTITGFVPDQTRDRTAPQHDWGL